MDTIIILLYIALFIKYNNVDYKRFESLETLLLGVKPW